MKKQTVKLFFLVTIVFGGLLAVWANRMPVKTAPLVTEYAPAESANSLYISNCARCHGADGKGNTQLGQEMGVPDLTITARRMSLTRVKNIISNGDGEMPAFKKKLKAAQINSLASYVRKMK